MVSFRTALTTASIDKTAESMSYIPRLLFKGPQMRQESKEGRMTDA